MYPMWRFYLGIQAYRAIVNELSIPNAKSKHIKLPFQAGSRRSSVDSVASAFSQESRQSTITSLGSNPRSKYLELEFYEEKGVYTDHKSPGQTPYRLSNNYSDCAAFARKLKHIDGS